MINYIINQYNNYKAGEEVKVLKTMIEREGYLLRPLIFHIEFYNLVQKLNYKRYTEVQLKNLINKTVCNIFQFIDVESTYLYDYLNDYLYNYLIGYETYTLDYEHYYNEMLESIAMFISLEDLNFIVDFDNDIKKNLYRPLFMTIVFKDGKSIKTKGIDGGIDVSRADTF